MNANSLETVSLVFGIPLTRSEFSARAPDSDWLGKFWDADASPSESARVLDERWERQYLPMVVEPLQEAIDVASEGGAEIHLNATLESLHQVTRNSSVVILFAHWKGPEILAQDIAAADDFYSIGTSKQLRDAELSNWIETNLARSGKTPQRSAVVKALDEWLTAEKTSMNGTYGTQVLEHPVTRLSRRRDRLDSALTGLLVPGNRLELFDGLHSKEAVGLAIASSFSGVLDLTVCTSTVLADYLGCLRKLSFRTVQFAKNVDFLWAGKCLAGTLRLCGDPGFEYLRTRDQVSRILDDAIGEVTGKRNVNG